MSPMPTSLIVFLGACTLVAASPGPSTVLIIKQSLHSRRSGFLTVLGNETGVFIWGVVAAFGLTTLLTASEVAYDVMRIVGAVVLVGFGVPTLRQARHAKGADDAVWEGTRKSGWASYRGGLLLNLANSKAAVFALSFLPQFVPEGAPHLPMGAPPTPLRQWGRLAWPLSERSTRSATTACTCGSSPG